MSNSSTDSDSIGGRKWVSEECLPRERSQSCSGRVLSGNGQACGSKVRSVGNIGPSGGEEHQAQPCRERPERKPLLPNRDLSFKKRSDQRSAVSLKSASKENIPGPTSHRASLQIVSCTDEVLQPSAGNDKPETVRETFSRSVGPKLKTALSKVFRKPPSGANGGRGPKALGRMASKFTWRLRRDRSLKDAKMSRSKCAVKTAVSCEALDQRTPCEDMRRWHSTEALMNKTSTWVEKQQGLFGWEEEQEDGEEAMSDCESLFSLDSLSSAYAAALAERLRREEATQSEAESEDSQMSKDSLTVANGGTCPTAGRFDQTVPPAPSPMTGWSHLAMRHNRTEISSDWDSGRPASVVSAEVHWCHRVSSESRHTGATTTSPSLNPAAADSRGKVHNSANMQASTGSSAREPENSMALTDAWSSADAADSPRIHRESLSFQRKMMFSGVKSSSSGPILTSSPSLTSTTSSGSQGSSSCSSTSTSAEGVNMQEQSVEILKATSESLGAPLRDVTCFVEQSGGQMEKPRKAVIDIPATSLTLDGTACLSSSVLLHTEQQASQESLPQVFTGEPNRGVPNRTPDAAEPSEDDVLCSLDDATEKHIQKCESGIITRVSLTKANLSDKVETNGSEPCAAGQQELVKSAAKNSRKRNKDRPDAFTGSLKMPKRSNSAESVMFCSASAGSQADKRPDGGDHAAMEADDTGLDSVCDSECSDSSCQSERKVAEGAETKNSRMENLTKQQESRKHGCKSDAICSAIDLRISEVVKEHMRLSAMISDDEGKSGSRGTVTMTSSACHVGCNSWTEGEPRREKAADTREPRTGHQSSTFKSATQTFDCGHNLPDGMSKTAIIDQCASQTSSTERIPSDMIDPGEWERSGNPPPLQRSTSSSISDSPSVGKCFDSQGNTAESDPLFQEGRDSVWPKATVVLNPAADPDHPEHRQTLHQTPSTPGETNKKRGCNGVEDEDKGCHSFKLISPLPTQHFHNGPNMCGAVKLLSDGGSLQFKAHRKVAPAEEEVTVSESAVTPETTNTAGRKPSFASQSRRVVDVKRQSKGQECVMRNVTETSTQESDAQLPKSSCSAVAPRQAELSTSGEKQADSALLSKMVKRCRRAKVQARHCSSSESSLKSSDDDEEDDKSARVNRSRLSFKCVKLCGHGRPEVRPARSNSAGVPEAKARAGSQKTPCADEEQHTPKSQDPLMHFASSDINPFVHQWQDDDPSEHCYKNPAFGSAADLSCKSPLLNSAEKRITRCCSVDNGLNGQNSPFNSHLSTFATKKGLSSTLSSMEDCKAQASETRQRAARPQAPGDGDLTATNGSSGNNAPAGFGNSSSRMDEIMFVYSSEPESQASKAQRKRTSEHGTQTDHRLPAPDASAAPKRRERHKRSNTDAPAAQSTKVDIKESPTWASMESMSAHLSKLIHSTSDLLGDVQGMRTGEGATSVLRRSLNLSNVSHRESENGSVRDGSTQTAADVGIQTEGPPTAADRVVAMNQTADERCKSHEVSLIVRVIGSEVVSMSRGASSERHRVLKKNLDEKMSRVPEGSVHTTTRSVSCSEKSPLKTPPLRAAGECQRRVKSASSGGSKQSRREALCHKGAAVSEKLSPSSRNEPALPSKKPATYTDRASSPILTVGAKIGAKPRKSQSTSRQDGFTAASEDCEISSCKSESVSLEKLSETSGTKCPDVLCSVSLSSSLDGYPETEKDTSPSFQQWRTSASTRGLTLQSCISPILRPGVGHRQQADAGNASSCTRPVSAGFCIDSYSPSDTNRTVQREEDDMVSLAPSECNTDVLVNIQPVTSLSPRQDHQLVPEDLPMHNKFSDWSGISQQQSKPSNKPATFLPRDHKKMRNCAEWGEEESCGSNVESAGPSDRRAREIERLRQEREQVMATVNLGLNPTPLTVELTEAKLHYRLGETDALLKMLTPSSRGEPEASTPAATKQQLYDRYRCRLTGR